MITINDNDLPITVAEKIISGTKPITDIFIKAGNNLVGGDGTQDMFTLEEIQEIVEYLNVYIKNHENGD